MSCTTNATSNTITLPSYAPANTVPPAVTGTAVVGQTLSTTNGTWTNSPSTYSYQWYRGATLISGATNSTYTLVQADAGQNIKCTVTASNGLSASADSNTVAILATLLDLYPSAAAAYSVRLLRGAHYTSSAIRVRRSNDNAEQDIGFTTAGDLNTSALTTFVGSNSAFIVTWYDQSGNVNNASQTTPASQPQIVNSGTIIQISSKPTIDTLLRPSMSTTSNIIFTHATTVAKIDTYNVVNYICFGSPSNNGLFYGGTLSSPNVNGLGAFDGTNLRSYGQEDLNRNIGWFSMRSSSLFVQKNNLSELNLGAFPATLSVNQVAGRNISTTEFYGKVQEIIFWNTNISSNKNDVITNINSYYGVY